MAEVEMGARKNPDLPRQQEQVMGFAVLMRQQLEAHQEKGDWRGADPNYLAMLLIKEVSELMEAAMLVDDDNAVWRKAANVANFALMVADVRTLIKP